MKALIETIVLELRRLARTRVIASLVILAAAWMALLPRIVRSDGTAAGAHELLVKYSLGGVFVLVAIALSASGAASLSQERASKRLALSLVTPAARFSLALGRTIALSLAGAAILAAAAALAFSCERARPCHHVLSPVMESPRDEAERMYSIFMTDPETPPEAKKAPKSVIMRLLTSRAVDNYQSIAPGDSARWLFPLLPRGIGTDATAGADAKIAVRLRFTNDFDVRDSVSGPLIYGEYSGFVSNITQAITITPLAPEEAAETAAEPEEAAGPGVLSFRNEGSSSLMLRPRKDINILVEADSFAANLLRTYVQLVASLFTLVAFAVFLGAGLGRPVAVFTCIAFLFAAAVAGDVIEQYPDSLESDRIDRIGLAITRTVYSAARPVAALKPLCALAADECVESSATLRTTSLSMACSRTRSRKASSPVTRARLSRSISARFTLPFFTFRMTLTFFSCGISLSSCTPALRASSAASSFSIFSYVPSSYRAGFFRE